MINILQQPAMLSSFNSPQYYVAEETGTITSTYRYLFQTDLINNENNNAVVNMGVFEIPANAEGKGIFSPHSILKQYYTTSLNFTDTLSIANQSMLKYRTKVGFKKDISIGFLGITSVSVLGNNLVNLAVFAGHGLQVGDEIKISLIVNQYNPAYNGIWEVVQVGTNSVVINCLYGNTVPVGTLESGVINQLVRMPTTYNTDIRIAINSISEYGTINSHFHTVKTAGTIYTMPYFVLDNYPDYKQTITASINNTSTVVDKPYADDVLNRLVTKKIRENDIEVTSINLYGTGRTTILNNLTDVVKVNKIVYELYNSNWTLTSEVDQPFSSSIQANKQNCIQIYTGWINEITDDIAYYKVRVETDNFSTTTAGYKFYIAKRKIDRTCKPKYYSNSFVQTIKGRFDYAKNQNIEPDKYTRIAFVNAMGGWSFWNFYNSKKTTVSNYTKQKFKRGLQYNYGIGDRQQYAKLKTKTEVTTIETDYITEVDYQYLQQLLESSEVYVIERKVNNVDGEIGYYQYPINIEDSSYTTKTNRQDKAFNITIAYTNAYEKNTQI